MPTGGSRLPACPETGRLSPEGVGTPLSQHGLMEGSEGTEMKTVNFESELMPNGHIAVPQ